jgi:nucleoside-diphosphate-sugar epimerase
MNVLVAGGTGVLGRASLRPLIEAGHHVRATARGFEKAQWVGSLGAEPIDVDLYDRAAVRRAIKGSDVLIRLTAKIVSLSAMRSAGAWEETNRLRTLGARTLVDAAIAEGVKVYIHESVVFVYRDGGSSWLMEDATTDDGGTRILRATLQGEQEAVRFSEAGGRGIILRFGAFYGADAPSSTELATMARRHLLAQIGSGSNYFSSIYVPDAGRAVAAAVGLPAGIYNVCDDDPLLFSQYVRIVVESAGAPKQLHLPGLLGTWLFGDVWKYFSRSLRVSNGKLRAASNWTPHARSAREGWSLTAHALRYGKTS